jgi:hypothetical protein
MKESNGIHSKSTPKEEVQTLGKYINRRGSKHACAQEYLGYRKCLTTSGEL